MADERMIVERAQALLPWANRAQTVLRLAGNIWGQTKSARESLPPDVFNGFPLYQTRLFSLVSPDLIACWRGRCDAGDHQERRQSSSSADTLDRSEAQAVVSDQGSNRTSIAMRPPAPDLCGRWTVESAAALQSAITEEFNFAIKRPKTERSNINLTITAAWLRECVCLVRATLTSAGSGRSATRIISSQPTLPTLNFPCSWWLTIWPAPRHTVPPCANVISIP